MSTEINENDQEGQKKEVKIQSGSSDSVYALGVIGAWVYYIRRSTNFQEGLKGFFKGIVWPAILVYELLTFLNKN